MSSRNATSQPENPQADDAELFFGDYRWVPGSGLYRGTAHIALPPKESALLELLISHGGEVVAHSVIEGTVWPRQQVSYSSLARCVYSLRKRLESDEARLIETVPKRGYRLAARVISRSTKPGLSRQQSVRTGALAYSHYLAGQREAGQPSEQALSRALNCYEAALAADPGYAVAWAASAEVRLYQILRGYISPADGSVLGLSACEMALQLDPRMAPALAARGWFQGVIQKDVKRGLHSLALAERTDPEYARLYTYRAWIKRVEALAAASLEQTAISIEIDPHDLLNRHAYTWSLFLAGRATQALEIERRLAAEVPEENVARIFCGIFAAYLGDHEFALQSGECAVAQSGESAIIWAGMAYICARAGRSQEARKLVDRAADHRPVSCPPGQLAPALVALGEMDRAACLIRQGLQDGCPWTSASRLDPRLASLFERADMAEMFPQPPTGSTTE